MKSLLCGMAATIAFVGSNARAAELTCSGRITQVIMHAPDRFMLKLDSMDYPVFFCTPNVTWSVSGTTYTTSAETCRVLVGTFLAAQAQDRRLAVIYFDGAEVPAACNAWGPWKSANVRYFQWD